MKLKHTPIRKMLLTACLNTEHLIFCNRLTALPIVLCNVRAGPLLGINDVVTSTIFYERTLCNVRAGPLLGSNDVIISTILYEMTDYCVFQTHFI
jgi:hypothetical protein